MAATEYASAARIKRNFGNKLLDIILCKQRSITNALESETEYRDQPIPDHAGAHSTEGKPNHTSQVLQSYVKKLDDDPKGLAITGSHYSTIPKISSPVNENLVSQGSGNSPKRTESNIEGPDDANPASARTYSNLLQTTDSLITAILEGIKEVGSNLPGIGAIVVALSLKDKILLERSNREEMEEILKYIEALCRNANGREELPDLSQTKPIRLSDDLIEDLKRASRNLKVTKGRSRIARFINANSIEAELKAVWEGIQRSLNKFQFEATLNVDLVLKDVFRLILSEAEKEEEKRIEDIINRMPIANLARFDAQRSKRSRVVSCSAGTRIEVMRVIQAWATSANDDGKHVFWLNGLAGTGKSTIAKSIAEWAGRARILGGSFFFARDVAELSNPALVFPTLASQLSRFDVQFKRALANVLAEDSASPYLNLEDQFKRLICKPLSACRRKRPLIIMLDALDECTEDASALLRIFLNYKADTPDGPNLRIFITSRPEARIRSELRLRSFGNDYDRLILHEIDEGTVRRDIKTYLHSEFAKIKSGPSGACVPLGWPSQSERDNLLDLCGKFFAYAATAIRFISDEVIGNPVEQLRDILQFKNISEDGDAESDGAQPYAELDILYLGVLNQSVSKTAAGRYLKRTRRVISTILRLWEPLDVSSLASLLSISTVDVREALRNLHSVILVPDEDYDDPVRFFHGSFPDFVQDDHRCTDSRFYIDPKSRKIRSLEHGIALRCIAEIGMTSFEFASEISTLVSYALKYWSDHLQAGDSHEVCSEEFIGNPNEPNRVAPYSRKENEDHEPRPSTLPTPQTGFEICDSYWQGSRNPTTLEQVKFRRTREWVTWDDDDASNILWLRGWEGSETFNLTASIVQWARDETNILPLCFFFTRDAKSNVPDDPRRFLTAMSAQLASWDTDFMNALRKILCENKDVATKTLDEQMELLILRPVSAFQREGKVLIIIDSLDKCTLEADSAKIMHILLRLVVHGERRFRIIVSSETENCIRELMTSNEVLQQKCTTLGLAEMDYIYHKLGTKLKFSDRFPSETGWSSAEDIRQLLYICGDSQVYAELALRFINYQGQDFAGPKTRLDSILHKEEKWQLEEDNSNSHYIGRRVDAHQELDNLFLRILERAALVHSHHRGGYADDNRIRQILATFACAREEFSSKDLLEFLFEEDEDDVKNALYSMPSIKDLISCKNFGPFDDLERTISCYWKEFIQEEKRCTDKRFIIDIPSHEGFMALQCVKIMRRRESFGNSIIKSYASTYWLSHIKSGTGLSDDLVKELIWLCSNEVLSRKALRDSTLASGEPISTLRSLLQRCRPRGRQTLLQELQRVETNLSEPLVNECPLTIVEHLESLFRAGTESDSSVFC